MRGSCGHRAQRHKVPGPYNNPPGTVAHKVEVGQVGGPPRLPNANEDSGVDTPGMDNTTRSRMTRAQPN